MMPPCSFIFCQRVAFLRSTVYSLLTGLRLPCEQTWAIRDQTIIATAPVPIVTLVQQLQIAWADGKGLVSIHAEQFPVADVFAPVGATVIGDIARPGKGIGLGSGQRCPRTRQAGCGE